MRAKLDKSSLENLLQRVESGELPVEQALVALKDLPFEDVGCARLDHHRALRQGFPEVIFCLGKTPEQTAAIFQRLADVNERVLATRATEAHYQAIAAANPEAEWHPQARIVRKFTPYSEAQNNSFVAIMTAGTADIPVAEEAALTLETLGDSVERFFDVGVAGLHRLLAVRSA
ncbi:MAG: 1-(5-phosphoribosyl)-5-amino-4-imidazole-carboxylate carboxylase, partial [Armatimonadota bacterium]